MRQVVCGGLAALMATTLVTAATSVRAESGEERVFSVSGFDTVKSVASDTIEIVPGNPVLIVADGDPRAVETLAVEVRDGTLRIGRTPGSHTDHGATVRVTVPALKGIMSAGSSTMRVAQVGGDEFAADLFGSGTIELRSVRVGKLKLKLYGSGNIIADGHADRTDIAMGGSGVVDAHGLANTEVAIKLSGVGTVAAAASQVARVDASGAGNIRIAGHPRCEVTKSQTTEVACG